MSLDMKKFLKLLTDQDNWILTKKYLVPGKVAKKYSCEIGKETVVFDDTWGDVRSSNMHIELPKKEYNKLIKHVKNCNQENNNKMLDQALVKLSKRVDNTDQRNINS